MKQEFVSLLQIGSWQTAAALIFFSVYLTNVFFALRRPAAAFKRMQEAPLNDE